MDYKDFPPRYKAEIEYIESLLNKAEIAFNYYINNIDISTPELQDKIETVRLKIFKVKLYLKEIKQEV